MELETLKKGKDDCGVLTVCFFFFFCRNIWLMLGLRLLFIRDATCAVSFLYHWMSISSFFGIGYIQVGHDQRIS